MSVDPFRHLKVFDPAAWGERKIAVVGAGATGSEVVVTLAKLGITNLHVWDPDVVADHNLANQLYGPEDIGSHKVAALSRHVQRLADVAITTHPRAADGPEIDAEVVFLLTDTMESRRRIAEALYYGRTGLIVETRLDADMAMVYTFNPNQPSHIAAWEATLYGDDEAHDSVCRTKTTVITMAKLTASLAVGQFLRWFSYREGQGDDPDHEVVITTQPMSLHTRKFDL